MNNVGVQPCPICHTTHAQPMLLLGGQTIALFACPHLLKEGKSFGGRPDIPGELSALRARVESIGRELSLAKQILQDHGIALNRLGLTSEGTR